jgi:hypothetical protein
VLFPRTWITGELVTASMLNQNLRDESAHPAISDGTEVDLVLISTEEPVFSETIPGGSMGLNGSVALLLEGDYFNNSGAGRTVRLRVKFGGTTIYDGTTSSLGATATRRIMRLGLILGNLGVANAQHLGGRFTIGTGAVTVGLGDIGLGFGPVDVAIGSGPTNPTIDTTTDQTLAVTIQHSASHASLSFRVKYTQLHLSKGD